MLPFSVYMTISNARLANLTSPALPTAYKKNTAKITPLDMRACEFQTTS